MAAQAGVSRAYLSKLERAVQKPSPDVRQRLAAALDLAPDELLEPWR